MLVSLWAKRGLLTPWEENIVYFSHSGSPYGVLETTQNRSAMWSTCGLLLKGPQVPRVLEILAINVYCSTIHNSSVIQPMQESNKREYIKKRCMLDQRSFPVREICCTLHILATTYVKLLNSQFVTTPKVGWANRINLLKYRFISQLVTSLIC